MGYLKETEPNPEYSKIAKIGVMTAILRGLGVIGQKAVDQKL